MKELPGSQRLINGIGVIPAVKEIFAVISRKFQRWNENCSRRLHHHVVSNAAGGLGLILRRGSKGAVGQAVLIPGHQKILLPFAVPVTAVGHDPEVQRRWNTVRKADPGHQGIRLIEGAEISRGKCRGYSRNAGVFIAGKHPEGAEPGQHQKQCCSQGHRRQEESDHEFDILPCRASSGESNIDPDYQDSRHNQVQGDVYLIVEDQGQNAKKHQSCRMHVGVSFAGIFQKFQGAAQHQEVDGGNADLPVHDALDNETDNAQDGNGPHCQAGGSPEPVKSEAGFDKNRPKGDQDDGNKEDAAGKPGGQKVEEPHQDQRFFRRQHGIFLPAAGPVWSGSGPYAPERCPGLRRSRRR